MFMDGHGNSRRIASAKILGPKAIILGGILFFSFISDAQGLKKVERDKNTRRRCMHFPGFYIIIESLSHLQGLLQILFTGLIVIPAIGRNGQLIALIESLSLESGRQSLSGAIGRNSARGTDNQRLFREIPGAMQYKGEMIGKILQNSGQMSLEA